MTSGFSFRKVGLQSVTTAWEEVLQDIQLRPMVS